MTPASVRINDELKAPKLSAGLLIFTPEGERVRMVRLPYKPLLVESVDLLWPAEKAGFEMKGRRYRGRLRAVARGGEIYIVNHLPLEMYLGGTLGGEMSPAWSMEALKAQAVAARSYALHRREKPRNALYDLDSSTDDQVYLGVAGESPRSWTAVRETAGVYLATGGSAADIHYHSRCGGETESAASVWGSTRTSAARIPCPFCRRFPYRWHAAWSPAEFLRKLGLPPSDRVAVLPVYQSPLGRVQEVEVATPSVRRRLPSDALRRMLGYTRLKSSRFAIQHTGREIRAEGVGSGHGVGMCQYGAKYLAEKGAKYSEILSHYYPRNPLARWAPEKGLDREQRPGVVSPHARPKRLRFSSTRRPDRAFPANTP
jgi:stage II sporulation protein D